MTIQYVYDGLYQQDPQNKGEILINQFVNSLMQ